MSRFARVVLRACVVCVIAGGFLAFPDIRDTRAAERQDLMGQEIDLQGFTVCGDQQDPALGEKAARAVALKQRGYEKYLAGASPECERMRYRTGPFIVEDIVQDESGEYVALVITTDEGGKGYVIMPAGRENQ